MRLLDGWENFYVILGSAAATLIGLTFVVIALLSDRRRANPAGVQGYITPTIVHFGTVLALAVFMSAPRQSALSLSLGFALGGFGTFIYSGLIAHRVRRFATDYTPVTEDWLWHVIFPALDYAVLLASAVVVWYRLQLALYAVAAALALLLFIGIHNALDVAVSVTVQGQKDADRDARRASGSD